MGAEWGRAPLGGFGQLLVEDFRFRLVSTVLSFVPHGMGSSNISEPLVESGPGGSYPGGSRIPVYVVFGGVNTSSENSWFPSDGGGHVRHYRGAGPGKSQLIETGWVYTAISVPFWGLLNSIGSPPSVPF